MDNILLLSKELANQTYRHGGYSSFYVTDPKLRHIHKASITDRLVHHAIYRQLYPLFDKIFIADSYSCRLDKGTHKALKSFRRMADKVSRNQTQTAWILQGDIRKFFDSINHRILIDTLNIYIEDEKIMWLLKNVIYSYQPGDGCGLPLGNLTSQLFVNIYMNVFDQFIKHK
jgi:retron-type reverse transcriptase